MARRHGPETRGSERGCVRAVVAREKKEVGGGHARTAQSTHTRARARARTGRERDKHRGTKHARYLTPTALAFDVGYGAPQAYLQLHRQTRVRNGDSGRSDFRCRCDGTKVAGCIAAPLASQQPGSGRIGQWSHRAAGPSDHDAAACCTSAAATSDSFS